MTSVSFTFTSFVLRPLTITSISDVVVVRGLLDENLNVIYDLLGNVIEEEY